jgi:hypothetical protein
VIANRYNPVVYAVDTAEPDPVYWYALNVGHTMQDVARVRRRMKCSSKDSRAASQKQGIISRLPLDAKR